MCETVGLHWDKHATGIGNSYTPQC